jgi:hypothetical protein
VAVSHHLTDAQLPSPTRRTRPHFGRDFSGGTIRGGNPRPVEDITRALSQSVRARDEERRTGRTRPPGVRRRAEEPRVVGTPTAIGPVGTRSRVLVLGSRCRPAQPHRPAARVVAVAPLWIVDRTHRG